MRAFKILVVVAGILMIAGYAWLCVELMRRSGVTAPAAEQAGHPAEGPLRQALGLEDAARVDSIVVVGNRAVALVRQPTGGDRLIVLDPQAGRVTAVIETGRSATP